MATGTRRISSRVPMACPRLHQLIGLVQTALVPASSATAGAGDGARAAARAAPGVSSAWLGEPSGVVGGGC